ncbi:hypothetical protein OAB57_01835 [Bacteriovoracaceae bacterium]|nr:hypothetical protein [Bacteriovoracaceae bacterium]
MSLERIHSINASPVTYSKDQYKFVVSHLELAAPHCFMSFSTLEKDISYILGLAHIIRRILENISRTGHSFKWKKNRYAEFRIFFKDHDSACQTVSLWKNTNWNDLEKRDYLFLSQSFQKKLWKLYYDLPSTYRDIIQYWLLQMVEGKVSFGSPTSKRVIHYNDLKIIKNYTEYNQHCYYTSGTILNLLIDICAHYYPMDPTSYSRCQQHITSFANTIQKTHLLTIFPLDRKRGLCFFPYEKMVHYHYDPTVNWNNDDNFNSVQNDENWKKHILENLNNDFALAPLFIKAIPPQLTGLRGLCLFEYLQAIKKADNIRKHKNRLFTSSTFTISRIHLFSCSRKARKLAKASTNLDQFFMDKTSIF